MFPFIFLRTILTGIKRPKNNYCSELVEAMYKRAYWFPVIERLCKNNKYRVNRTGNGYKELTDI